MKNILCFLFFLTSVVAASCKNNDKFIDERLELLSKKLSIKFLINSKYRIEEDSLYNELNCKAYNASIIWVDSTVSNANNIKVQFNNDYGLKLTFELSKLADNLVFLSRLIADKDTLSYKVTDKNIEESLADNNFYLLWGSGIVKEYRRFDRTINSYSFSDKIVKDAMKLRYGTDSVYEQTKRLIADNKVAAESGYVKMHMDHDTLCLLGGNTVIVVKDAAATVMKIYSIVKYYHGALIGIYPVIADDVLHEDYFFSAMGVMCHGDTTYALLGKLPGKDTLNLFKKNADYRVWGMFVKNNKKQLVFNKVTSDTFPDEYLNYHMLYMFNNAIPFYPYYMMPMSNVLRSIVSGKQYVLSNLFESKMEMKNGRYNQAQHVVFDFKIDKNFITTLIINDNRTFYYVQYDPRKDKMLVRKKLWDYNPVKLAPNIDKWDHNYIIYVNGSTVIRDNIALYK